MLNNLLKAIVFGIILAYSKKEACMKQKIIALLLTFITLIPFSNGIVQAAEKATPVKSTYIISSDSSFAPFVFQNESN